MRQAGEVIRTDIATYPDGSPKGNGTVVFVNPQDAKAAIGKSLQPALTLGSHADYQKCSTVSTGSATFLKSEKTDSPVWPVDEVASEVDSEELSHLEWVVWEVWVEVDLSPDSEVDSLLVSEAVSEVVEVDLVDLPVALAAIITVVQLPCPEDETLPKTFTPITAVQRVHPLVHQQAVRP